jgi:hypothetical protein
MELITAVNSFIVQAYEVKIEVPSLSEKDVKKYFFST